MKKIYIAASFAYAKREKTEERKMIIRDVVDQIKRHLDAEFYLPQELQIENAWDYSLEDWGRLVYEQDLEHLITADVVIFISFGKENNAGAVWEVGFAAGQNSMWGYCKDDSPMPKQIIMIKMNKGPESLMVTNSVNTIISKNEIDTYDWHVMPSIKTSIPQLS